MKKTAAFITAVVLTVSLSGCGKDKKASAPSADTTAINVSVYKAEKTSIEDTVTYTGEIKASESTVVSSKVSGIAKAVYGEVGDYVQEGEALVQIDDTDYRNQYNQVKASYESALAQYNTITNGTAQQTKLQLEAALNSAKLEYNNAKINLDNQKVLYENGAISKVSYDAAVTRYESAQINLNTAQSNYDLTVGVVLSENKATAQAALNSASAALQSAKTALENTVVRAPISGYISNRVANKGQMVAQGTEVVSIKSTQVVDAQINLTEAVIPLVQVGTKAIVNVKSAGVENIEGVVTTLSPVKDSRTGMYVVRVSIDNYDGLLKDGMFADITLTLSDNPDALVIPAEAVLEDEDGNKYVYIAEKNTAKRIDVKVGIITDEYAEIASGLDAGDKVITSGKEYLSDKNNKIKIVK